MGDRKDKPASRSRAPVRADSPKARANSPKARANSPKARAAAPRLRPHIPRRGRPREQSGTAAGGCKRPRATAQDKFPEKFTFRILSLQKKIFNFALVWGEKTTCSSNPILRRTDAPLSGSIS